ncbi:Ltp family lipoprotein [Staphylococcus simulans]|uniref:Ltp family lipoprotein n=1 Tax=Staphylococcus simulans TaxID=1286 RepID=UPI000E68B96F|nr:Ltp family lipoprotein [Staphylococcus simulans]RIN77823.1 hypothetical protein BU015_04940 [Staphylococcus simulans]
MAKKEEVYYNEHGERVYPNKKKKRPFLFGCLGLIVLILVIVGCTAAMSGGGSNSGNTSSDSEQTEDTGKNATREQRAALSKAKTYSETMHMSKQGIYDQLTSDAGEKFPEEAAQYAVDNLKVNYKENAVKSAENYADSMNMSDDAIYDQLTSQAGDKFTQEEAQYAVDHMKK